MSKCWLEVAELIIQDGVSGLFYIRSDLDVSLDLLWLLKFLLVMLDWKVSVSLQYLIFSRSSHVPEFTDITIPTLFHYFLPLVHAFF